MNPRTLLLNLTVLCTLLAVVAAASTPVDNDEDKKSSSRRRRCRCKKYIAQINQDIDKRLKAFENKFERYFENSVDAIGSDKSSDNSINPISLITENVNATRGTLLEEGMTLKKLQRTIRSQEVTVDTLNDNFKALDKIVRNLSRVVEKLEWTMRSSLEFKTLEPSTADLKKKPLPKEAEYPKG